MDHEQLKVDHDTIIRMETKLDAILVQATRTNGRVTKLEGWKMYMSGGIALFCLIVLPVIFFTVRDSFNTRDLLIKHVAQDK
jgi:hypothetical protein